ncbi:acyltransferase ChoActase/COT/CPT, partial [Syncephalis pseudoplumigaleata]
SLPHLPVPALKETFTLYLRSLKPLLTPQQLAIVEANIADFLRPGGLGEALQLRLVDAAAKETAISGNWLANWWTRHAYLQCRAPLLINSNCACLLRDDMTLHDAVLSGRCSTRPNSSGSNSSSRYSSAQVKRAVCLVQGCLDVKEQLESGTFPVDRTRNGPLCMHQYYGVYGTTRIPKPECDVVRTGSGSDSSHPESMSRDVVLILDKQLYRVPVYSEDHHRLSDADMECAHRQFWRAIRAFEERQMHDAAVCLFTCDHRDIWAEARQRLIDLDSTNAASLDAVEGALFTVRLEDFAIRETVAPGDEEAAISLSFRNAIASPHGLWADKSLSLIVERDGRAGINADHSVWDAVAMRNVAETIAQRPLTCLDPPPAVSSAANVAPPEALHFVLDDVLEDMLRKTRERVMKAADDPDIRVHHFRAFGIEHIKRTGRVSPDAFIQMALQLAYYTMHGKFTPIYETASTRAYLKGRTETVRSLSPESRAWCEAMRNPAVADAERYRLLQAACKAHARYLKLACHGRGCDRHMLGLRMMLREGEQHPIFTDDAFRMSQNWRLSTSALNTTELSLGNSFCTMVEDGYSVCYHPRPASLLFVLESKKSSLETSTHRLERTLLHVLHEMYALC